LSEYRVILPNSVCEYFGFDHGRQLVLVDTPGFDNSTVLDTEILSQIAKWLKESSVTFSRFVL